MSSRGKSKPKPPASDAPTANKAGAEKFPHELRAGDVVIDEHGDELELLGRPAKSVHTGLRDDHPARR